MTVKMWDTRKHWMSSLCLVNQWLHLHWKLFINHLLCRSHFWPVLRATHAITHRVMGAACLSWKVTIALTHERHMANMCPPKCRSDEDWRWKKSVSGNVPRKKDVCNKSEQFFYLKIYFIFSIFIIVLIF